MSRAAASNIKWASRHHATCVINFDGATGWLVGKPNKGMSAMFTMMNEARLAVGLQGLGLAEVAYQNAVAYAKDRLQMPFADRHEIPRQASRSADRASRCAAQFAGDEITDRRLSRFGLLGWA